MSVEKLPNPDIAEEIEALRSLARKLSRLMPGPRGHEIMLTKLEYNALMRAKGANNVPASD